MKLYLSVWKKYVEFSGRANRSEYWVFSLVNTVIAIFIGGLSGMLTAGVSGSEASMPTADPLMILYYVFSLAAFLPNLGVSIRRLHDTGRSGLWLFIGFVPLIGGVTLFVFMVLDSEKRDNRFGPAQQIDPQVFE